MASHYTDRALRTPLPPGKKLVLAAIADSANSGNRISDPGLDAMCSWSGLKKSRVMEVVAELVTMGLVARHRHGVPGRRAEYVIFPHGCCAEHGALPGKERRTPEELVADTVENRSGGPDVSAVAEPVAEPVDNTVNRSGGPDVFGGTGPETGPETGPVQDRTPLEHHNTSSGAVTYSGTEGSAPAVHSPPTFQPAGPAPAPPPRTCGGDHPEQQPCGLCRAARLAFDAWEAEHAAAARAAARAVEDAERAQQRRLRADAAGEVRACRLCDESGTASLVVDGQRDSTVCQHDAARNERAVRVRRSVRSPRGHVA